MKTIITLNVIVETIDVPDIVNQLEEWFTSNDIGMEFHSINQADLCCPYCRREVEVKS